MWNTIEINYETTSGIFLENIKVFQLVEVMIEYDEKIFHALRQRNYRLCEEYLADFCFEMLNVSEEEQLIILKTFFVSIINEILKIKIRKKRLHPQALAHAYGMVNTIEKWNNLTEYVLSISTFVEYLRRNIIGTELLFEGNKHIERALTLIDENLKGRILTVDWLAKQLNISTTYLTNLFKIHLDDTVSNFIMKRKMDEVIYELTYTTKTLEEIREKYGFHNKSHFIKVFKKFHGVTPLQYMKRIQNSV